MFTDLILGAMESSEYRSTQYPDDSGGGSGVLIVGIIWGVVIAWCIFSAIMSRKNKTTQIESDFQKYNDNHSMP